LVFLLDTLGNLSVLIYYSCWLRVTDWTIDRTR
jgi:hypothetical protein